MGALWVLCGCSVGALWVPLGILEFTRGVHVILQPWPSFGYSKETSNFIAERRVEHTINCKQQSNWTAPVWFVSYF